MVNEVNKLIFNTLLDAGAIYIPELGTICISHTTARKMFRGRVASPTYSTSFSTACAAVSLTDAISSVAHVDMADAEDIARRWLKKSSTDGRVVIEGVGTISNGSFVADKEFIATLEQTNKVITLSKGKSSNAFAWVASIIVLLCLCGGVGAYLIYGDNSNKTVENSDLVATNNTSETTLPEAIANTETTDTAASDGEAPADTEAETLISESSNSETAVIAETAIKPNDEEVTAENDSPELVSEEEIAEEPVAEDATSIDNDASEAPITDWRYASVRHYVIYGSYSVPSNANNAIRKIMRKNPAAQCKIIKLGNMHAVAVYGSYSRRDCEIFKRNHRSLYRNAWIHTPKRFK